MIPADDRGFTLGDGLFETILVRDGEPVLWDRHVERLRRAASQLGLPAPEDAACTAAAKEALAGFTPGRVALRLSWSAGSGGRGLERPAEVSPRLVASAAPSPAAAGPATLATAQVRRNEASPVSRLKTLSYLDNVLARREARALGADEALMLNTRGELACAAAANLFWIKGRTLATPALDCGVLDGIVRGVLMERARAAGWTVGETRADPTALDEAEAVFLTNSLIGVRPVSALDGRTLPEDPRVGELAALVADVT